MNTKALGNRLGLRGLARTLMVALIGASTAGLRAQTLDDFGYENMSSKYKQSLLAILVNFTNNGVAFLTNGVSIGSNYAAATNYYANWLFNPEHRPENLREYFFQTSGWRFRWQPGGAFMVTMDAQLNHASYEWAGDNQTLLFSSNIMWHALNSGQFDFRAYDTNADGTVTDKELTVVVISNDPTFAGAGVRWPGTVKGADVDWRGAVALCQSYQGIGTIGHEMVHLLQEFNGGKGFDIYGERCLSDHLTIMGCATDRVYVDAWHRFQFGWLRPQLVRLREGGQFQISVVQEGLLDALLLYDPSGPNGLQEYFLVEYRSTNYLDVPKSSLYDYNVGGSGMVVWHVAQASDKAPKYYVPAAMPSAEAGWSLCQYCRGLFHSSTSAGQCASTNGVHASNPDVQDDIYVLTKNDASAQGIPAWKRCTKCQLLYYSPNEGASSCPAGGHHSAASGDYKVPVEGDTDTIGRNEFQECNKCRALYRNTGTAAERVCPAGGSHEHDTSGMLYAVTTTGARAMMSLGAPNLVRGGSVIWGSGDTTPRLRWYAGEEIPVRLRVLPFTPGDRSITVQVLRETDTWVDFAWAGNEEGTFTEPYNTFGEGVNNSGYGGVLHIKAGTSAETRHVTKPMKIESYGGPARIGRQ